MLWGTEREERLGSFAGRLFRRLAAPSGNEPDFKAKINEARKAVLASYDKKILATRQDFTENLGNGVFETAVDGVFFKGLFIGCEGSRRLTVVFSGADADYLNPDRKPSFPRWSYYGMMGENLLCIDDPMFYAYEKMHIGWYYGTKDVCWLRLALQIVDAVCRFKGVDYGSVTFFGSSGGGRTAVRAAELRPGSMSVSINPTLYLANSKYAKEFMDRTGFDLKAPDPLGRHDALAAIRSSPRSKHLIVVNAGSDRDWNGQMVRLGKAARVDLRYGLNLCFKNRVLVWVYDAAGTPDPHVSFETRALFGAVMGLAGEFRTARQFSVDSWNPAALLAGECWHDVYTAKRLAYEIGGEGEWKLETSKRHLAVGGTPNAFSSFRYAGLEGGREWKIVFRGVSKNVKEFTAGVYDLAAKKIVRFRLYPVDAENAVSFFLPQKGKFAFLVYAGRSGKTAGKSLALDFFKAYSRPRLEALKSAAPAGKKEAK